MTDVTLVVAEETHLAFPGVLTDGTHTSPLTGRKAIYLILISHSGLVFLPFLLQQGKTQGPQIYSLVNFCMRADLSL